MSSHNHPYGKSENVLGFSKDDKVFVRDEPLRDMFLHPDVKNRKIVAFSIIGAYRKGKSFFLDYCLRYLYAHYPSINYHNNPVSNPTGWLGDEKEPLSGFSWRSGTDRDTTGIVMWNDIFLHTMEASGENVAIILVDTHGLFDNGTSSLNNSRIFTLDTLISSVQVFNLSNIIQDDHLQYLQSAIECAKCASNKLNQNDEKHFQTLWFLIRDWSNTEEFCYGIEGGKNYWEHFIKKANDQQMELSFICESILNSFKNVSCALFPHPGKIVATGLKDYNGNHGKIDEDFVEELDKLIDHLLRPENLIVKKVNGRPLNGEEFCKYIENQLKIFEKDELLQSQSVRESMIRKEMEALLSACLDHYKEVVGDRRKTIQNDGEIPLIHEQSKEKAIKMFNESKKMGSIEEQEKYKKILNRKMDDIFKDLIVQHINEKCKLKEEKHKLEVEMEEIKKREFELIEQEIKAREEELEKVKQNSKEALEHENQIKEQEFAEFNQQTEQKCAEIRNNLEASQRATNDEIKEIQKKVEESRLERQNQGNAEANKDQNQLEESKQECAEKSTQSLNNIVTQTQDVKIVIKYIEPALNLPLKVNFTDKQSESGTANSNENKDFQNVNNEETEFLQNSQYLNTKSNHDSHTKQESLPKIENTSNSAKISATSDNNQTSSKAVQTDLELGSESSTSIPSESMYANDKSISCPVEPHEVKSREENKNKEYKKHQAKATSAVSDSNQNFPQSSSTYTSIDHSSSKMTNLQDTSERANNAVLKDRPIKFITFSQFSSPIIDIELLMNIFGSNTVKYRKVVALSIVGIDNDDKTRTLNYCLDFLYKNYPSLNHQNKSNSKSPGWISCEDYHSSRTESLTTSLEIWNDVFLHTANNVKDDIAIILISTQGLFESANDLEYSLKIFLLGTLLSSIQVINLPDFLGEGRQKYFYLANRLKEYNASKNKGINKENFAGAKTLWNSLEWDKGVLKNLYKMYNYIFLPNINQTILTVFNRQPEKKILPFLRADNLIFKEINGLSITGSEFLELITVYHQAFQDSTNPTVEEIHQITIQKEYDIYINRCIACYNDYVLENQKIIKSDIYKMELHTLGKKVAENMFMDFFKDREDCTTKIDSLLLDLKSKLDSLF